MTSGLWTPVLAFPEGYSLATYRQRSYAITAHTYAGGRSRKVLARQLGGRDFISFNCYRTSTGTRLKPCEMPAERVLEFIEQWQS